MFIIQCILEDYENFDSLLFRRYTGEFVPPIDEFNASFDYYGNSNRYYDHPKISLDHQGKYYDRRECKTSAASFQVEHVPRKSRDHFGAGTMVGSGSKMVY